MPQNEAPGSSDEGASYPPRARSRWFERWIDVRPGEGAALAWSIGYFFCLLLTYYVLKPMRDTFGIEHGYEELAPLMTGTLLVTLLASPLFALLVSRVPRRRFLPLTYRFFLANLLLFYALLLVFLPADGKCPRWISYAFFVWVSVFNVFAVSIFWGFVSDVFSSVQAKRLFGLIAVGGTLGTLAGSLISKNLVASIGTPGLVLLAALTIEASAQCARQLLRRADPSRVGAAVHAHAEEPGRRPLAGIGRVLGSRYLQGILVYVLVYGLTNTLLYMEQNRIVEGAFTDRAARTAAFAQLDLWQNLAVLAVQLTLSGRILRWIGLGPALTIVPTASLLGFAALTAGLDRTLGAYTLIMIVQVVRRSLHYAVDRPAREVLFTVVDADARYKSKNLIDTFVFRLGDMSGGWTVRVFALANASLGILGLPIAALGVVLGLVLGPMQSRRQGRPDAPRRELGEAARA